MTKDHATVSMDIALALPDNELLHLVEAVRSLAILLEQTPLVAVRNTLDELLFVPSAADQILEGLAFLPLTCPDGLVSGSKSTGVAADVELVHALGGPEDFAAELCNGWVRTAAADELDPLGLGREHGAGGLVRFGLEQVLRAQAKRQHLRLDDVPRVIG